MVITACLTHGGEHIIEKFTIISMPLFLNKDYVLLYYIGHFIESETWDMCRFDDEFHCR